jgi:hypothetical protein
MEEGRAGRLEILKALAASWGGVLREVSKEEFRAIESANGFELVNKFARAPFTSELLGINFHTKEVIFAGQVGESSIIHEMGHVFATEQEPRYGTEWDFFGWEFVLARHIGLPVKTWLKGNSDYVVDDEQEISSLKDKEICQMLHERVRFARKAGIVKNFKPLAVR